MGFYFEVELNEEQYNDMLQKIDENGYVRIHHAVKWSNCTPCIISEKYKKYKALN